MSKHTERWPWYIKLPTLIVVYLVALVLVGYGCELIYNTFALIRRL